MTPSRAPVVHPDGFASYQWGARWMDRAAFVTSVHAEDLGALWGLPPETVRRFLAELADHGWWFVIEQDYAGISLSHPDALSEWASSHAMSADEVLRATTGGACPLAEVLSWMLEASRDQPAILPDDRIAYWSWGFLMPMAAADAVSLSQLADLEPESRANFVAEIQRRGWRRLPGTDTLVHPNHHLAAPPVGLSAALN